MKPEKLYRRWQRLIGELVDEAQGLLRECRARPEAERVHRLRVALRRLRLMVRLGRPFYPPEVTQAFNGWAKTVVLATSRARDLDVAIEWLTLRPGSEGWVERLQARRERCWRAAHRRFRQPPAGVITALATGGAGRGNARRLGRRFNKFEARFQRHVQAQLTSFSGLGAEERHEFRRTLRSWRYLRELALPRRQRREDRLLQQLHAAQEVIGEHQNRTLTRLALEGLRPALGLGKLEPQLAREQAILAGQVTSALNALAAVQHRTRAA